MSATLLHRLVERRAASDPDAVAVVDGERVVTYADLDAAANRLARLLRHLGVARGDRVGLYLDKSADSVIGIYAAMKAGAAYVPLDPGAPPARLAYIARDCEIHCLITSAGKAEAWRALVDAGAPIRAVVAPDVDDESLFDVPPGVTLIGSPGVGAQPVTPPPVDVINLDLAYILYTSGSTGEPKGVMLSHLNALTFVDWAVRYVEVHGDDRLSSHAPLHFDLSTFDLFAAAHAGARVVLVPPQLSLFPPRLARWIDDAGISVWYSVPSVLNMLALRGGIEDGGPRRLRALLFAGEVFPTPFLRRLMHLIPRARFINLYGPTETNVCTYYEVPPIPEDQTASIPIGRAIDDVEVFAVTDDGGLAASGEVGELLVRGASVMRGYWNDVERTRRVLHPHPFGGPLADDVYRTGDLVRRRSDGDFDFLGRRDSQIKSRGYRIELGEIENALHAHPAVVECAVVAVPDDLATNRIHAFLVTREPVTTQDLVRACAERIPRYMIPESFEQRPALPRTSTGKIDRRELATWATGGPEKEET